MHKLLNTIRPYAWGSRTTLAALRGDPTPSPGPEAELWLGAHPSAPSEVAGVGLDALISRDPTAILGSSIVDSFGPRLPYLLKLLAAEAPLSIQAHPDESQARDGFANRGYVDPFHKPELLVAVAEFDALCGFRAPVESATEFAALGLPELKSIVDALGSGPAEVALRSAMELLLSLPDADSVVSAAAARHPLVAELTGQFPGDRGALVALLLNRVRLQPDEAVFMPAGNLHAYLNGFGVEIMAASDNVIRGGLTVKPVDVGELMRILRFEVLDDPVLRPVPLGPGLLTWPTPIREFSLVKGVGPVTLPSSGPRIVVCLRGHARLSGTLDLAPGESAFVPATEPPVSVTGDAHVFQASPA